MIVPCCRLCGQGLVNPRPARLDQSGDTYLPAKSWECVNQGCRCAGENLAALTLPTGEPWLPRRS